MLRFETSATHRDNFPYHTTTTSQKGMTMTAIDTQLSAVEKVLAPMRKGALKTLDMFNTMGWNEKGITSEQLGEMLFHFALDNMNELTSLSDDDLRMGGGLVFQHVLYQDLLNVNWDVSALSL